MSRSMRIVLAIAAAVLFLCCVAGLGLTLLGTRTVGKAVITDPTRIAAVGSEMVSYQLPSGFKELFASELLGLKMLAIGPADPKADLMIIMLMQMPTTMKISEDDLRQQVEGALTQQTGMGNASMTVVGAREATIRGQNVPLTVREGKTSSGQVLRQLSGLFSGLNGPIFLFVTGDAAVWDQPLLDGFIASIR